MERRHSTASDTSTDSRQSSNEGLETGRISKPVPPKVATNPLQFVKVGPCDLYRSAQEQLKKVEEIKKKAKTEYKDEAEDWQSNLDNWKCSRRKRQEHIIERVVEVKKFELEEHERNRRRSKTFSEMMQERNVRGRKSSLPVWNDDSEDLSDLGINGRNDSSIDGDRTNESSDDTAHNSSSDLNGDRSRLEDCKGQTDFKEKPKSNTESEEYTYERAIQSYVNFAETRVKSRSTKSIDEDIRNSKETKKESPPIPAKPKRGSVTKIDSFISQIESNKNLSNSNSSEASKKNLALPKVDVNQRKALFENSKESEEQKKVNKTADVVASKSIKERLSSLEKHQENVDNAKINASATVGPRKAIKERLSSIEKLSSSTSSIPRRTSEPLSTQTIKERLSSFEKSKVSPPKSVNVVEATVSIKDRLNSLHSSCEKEAVKTVIPNADPAFNEKLSNFKEGSQSPDSYDNRAFSPEDIYQKREDHFRHRSLDSLDINQENMSNGSFERVQSLEDLDYRNYPASTFSGDTDREDSGIHTADVSSSVSQADDYDLHLDGNILDDIKTNHQPPIEEETKLSKSEVNQEEPLKCVSDEDSLAAKSLTPDSSFSELLPPIHENPSEPITSASPLVEEPLVHSYHSTPYSSSSSSHCNNQLPEDTAGEFQVPQSTQLTVNHLLNQSNNLDGFNNQHDPEISTSGLTGEETCSLTGGGFGGEAHTFSDLKDSKLSNQLPTLDASFSKYIEESSKFIMEERRDFEKSLPKPLEPVPTFEEKPEPPLLNKNGPSQNSSFSDVSQYKLDQPGNIVLPYENLKIDLNVPIVNQLTEIVVDNEPKCLFPLSSAVLEPPKEKPPPPPVEISDEETEKNATKKSLRRLDSTKRIKKELRQKRSSFLGIEGNDDDSYLEPELELMKPPDMTTLLAEERRVERQLYRQSVCSESDSNQESRDSGVELDHKHPDCGVWSSHSRNDSETFGNHSATSDEEEIMKKEREIIETLEKEEKIRKQDLGEKLAMRLRELEAEKERWGQLEPALSVDVQPPPATSFPKHNHASAEDLDKCRGREELNGDWYTPSSSLQDISHIESPLLDFRGDYRKSLGDLSAHPHRHHNTNQRYAGHRRSMPNLQEMVGRRPPPPPPPVLPLKGGQHHHQPPPPLAPPPLQAVPAQRVAQPRVSQHHSQQVQAVQHTAQPVAHHPSAAPAQMSKHTLQALSAAPKPRILSNDSWQVRKKQQRPDAYNYQHWLIQEAEQRRITEQSERSAARRSEVPRQGSWPAVAAPRLERKTVQGQALAQPSQHNWGQTSKGKHIPDAIIQTLTQRVQSRLSSTHHDPNNNRRRQQEVPYPQIPQNDHTKEKMLSVSGKKRCSHCGDELGRGAAMIIESLQLFYHIDCFKCCVCCIQLGDGLNGTDVRVRNNKLHCHNCYSSDDGNSSSFPLSWFDIKTSPGTPPQTFVCPVLRRNEMSNF